MRISGEEHRIFWLLQCSVIFVFRSTASEAESSYDNRTVEDENTYDRTSPYDVVQSATDVYDCIAEPRQNYTELQLVKPEKTSTPSAPSLPSRRPHDYLQLIYMWSTRDTFCPPCQAQRTSDSASVTLSNLLRLTTRVSELLKRFNFGLKLFA